MSCHVKIHGHADNGRAIPSYGILTTASVHVKDSVYLSKLNLMQGIVFALLNVESAKTNLYPLQNKETVLTTGALAILATDANQLHIMCRKKQDSLLHLDKSNGNAKRRDEAVIESYFTIDLRLNQVLPLTAEQ
ncbi:hypothetical protein EVAR_99032_1 [Eumeta japonica]|uniref:Uncharacterized protein n=1 Tax=Eumeta variegata TaxID=151549 RepID=A0A4C2ADZ8_EUMVA|nr:hypothetical protein EVAR_99032_1 [Eumeta japonica]